MNSLYYAFSDAERPVVKMGFFCLIYNIFYDTLLLYFILITIL